MINYLGNKTNFKEMLIDLRKRGVDPNNDISDEYIINEAYNLGEWNY